MNIGLDFDGTYTLDPDFWDNFVIDAEEGGHNVFVVTNRLGDETDDEVYSVPVPTDNVFFTAGKAKHPFMKDSGIHIDVWIDNEPEYIKENKID